MELEHETTGGQASEEFNGQAGFSETGGFWNSRAGRRRRLRRRGLAAAPYEGTPAFRTLGRTGMKITIVSMGAMRTSEPAIFQAAFDKGQLY